MDSLKARIKTLVMSAGANLVGITTTDVLEDGPPSADPRYLLPSANSVVSYAVSLDKDIVQDYISKKKWAPHCKNRKAISQLLYTVGDKLVEYLQSEGFEAVNVDLNANYRPENGASDVTEMTEFHPDFSHRYAALAAGIGRLGWSGNLMTKEYGSLVELGSVLTSAKIKPDNPISDDEHPCDKCKMCSKVCPVEMVQSKASTQVIVAGVTETISKKQSNTLCWIGCTGYEGLASSGTWSNWSPYRLGRPLPKDKQELDVECIRLQKMDPQMRDTDNSFNNYRKSVFDPNWFYYTICGFCRSVCAPNRKERLANRRLIINSGTAALKSDGSHVVADDNAVEWKTPFGLNVIAQPEELSDGQPKIQLWPGQFPLDREVIEYLSKKLKSVDVKEPYH